MIVRDFGCNCVTVYVYEPLCTQSVDVSRANVCMCVRCAVCVVKITMRAAMWVNENENLNSEIWTERFGDYVGAAAMTKKNQEEEEGENDDDGAIDVLRRALGFGFSEKTTSPASADLYGLK